MANFTETGPEFQAYQVSDLPPGVRRIAGGVTAAPGFRAGSVACGVKAEAGAPDLAVLVADAPCVTAALFTTNRVPAHPVRVCKAHLAASQARAQVVVVNSGNANCANGERGDRDAERMAQLTAERFGVAPELALVSSTGIIGRFLPMEKIERGVAEVEVGPQGGQAFAEGIMTTDTRPKSVAVEFELGGKTIHLGGATKGVGMIYPNMATMLCYLTTDLAADPAYLQRALADAVADSFNMVCVDGDMSTNDSVFLFANGAAGNEPLRAESPDAERFLTALRYVTRALAREMARDGEGATRLMVVTTRGAASERDARLAARAVTASPLWQCAIAGSDPNWGRVIAALGASGADLDPERIELTLGETTVVRDGVMADYAQADAKRAVSGEVVRVAVDLHAGEAGATAWGCDLTHGYIDENTTYTR